MNNNDGHDSACTYRQCAHPESQNPCPFEQDVKLDPSIPTFKECKHEWRQLFTNGDLSLYPDGFYCIFDPEHRKPIRT